MSKPVTIAAAMTLVDEGKLALTDPIAQWVPELANPRVMTSLTGPLDRNVAVRRPITIDDLMTHRSGLAYGFSVPAPLGTAYTKLQTLQDPDRWLAALGELPLAHQPGEQLTYSQSTDVLGFILARIEGKPLSDVLAERIFEPLGMVDTGFSVTTSGRRRAATMYRLVPGDNDDVTLQHGVMGPPQVVPPKFCAGGGGLWSTADDYLRFARMLLGNGEVDGVRVLSEESAQLMRTDQLTAEQKSQDFLGAPFWIGRGFGLNLSVVTDSTKSAPFYGPGGVGTFSWPGAFGTWWQADPQANLILIYLTDLSDPERTRTQCGRRSRGRRQHVTDQIAFCPTKIRAPDVQVAGAVTHLDGPQGGSVCAVQPPSAAIQLGQQLLLRGPMSTLITNSGAMEGWSRSHDDVASSVKGVADGAAGDPNLLDSHGPISQPMLAAQKATNAARNEALGATHTESTTIAELLSKARQAYDEGDAAGGDRIRGVAAGGPG
jgi:CubicO group peptidase (beta-lactamase class C family)